MLKGQDIARLGIALAGSMLVHGLLLGTRMSSVDNVRVGPASSTSFHFDIMLSKPAPPRHKNIKTDTSSKKQTGKLALHKSHDALKVKEQKIAEPSSAQAMKPENTPARTLGTTWTNAVNQRTMMMRARQFFFSARSGAQSLIRQSLPSDKMAHYYGKHCLLELVEDTEKEQGYAIDQAECDDPELLAEVRAMPWDTLTSLPSRYSLPYRGLIIRMAFDSFQVSVGVSALVDQAGSQADASPSQRNANSNSTIHQQPQ